VYKRRPLERGKECRIMGRDFIPKKQHNFTVWFKNFLDYVERKCSVVPPAVVAEWTHIPAVRIERLRASYEVWYAAYDITLGVHTPAETLAKDKARVAAEGVIRPFVNEFIRYGPITDRERLEAGCHAAVVVRQPATKPPGTPRPEVDTSRLRTLIIRFRPQNSRRRGKPKGARGAELHWVILDAPPVNVSDLIHTEYVTASPYTLAFH
jgi:hypothetical protein